jgi:putative protease
LKKKRTSKKKKVVRKSAVKRIVKKRPLKKKAAKKKAILKKPRSKAKEAIIGKVTHYFPKVRAAVVKIKSPLTKGDSVKIKGHTTDFTQRVISMQVDHVPVEQAKKGQEIGLLVDSRVRQHDIVYKA